MPHMFFYNVGKATMNNSHLGIGKHMPFIAPYPNKNGDFFGIVYGIGVRPRLDSE